MASGRTFFEFVTFCRTVEATLDHVVLVTADVHELRSGVPKRLEALGVTVFRRRLPIGDYGVGPDAIVERKSVLDLQDSLLKGRLWLQIAGLRRAALWPSLADVVAAHPSEWQSVRGVGPQRAAALASMVHDEWASDRTTSHSDLNRNGNSDVSRNGHPAT